MYFPPTYEHTWYFVAPATGLQTTITCLLSPTAATTGFDALSSLDTDGVAYLRSAVEYDVHAPFPYALTKNPYFVPFVSPLTV